VRESSLCQTFLIEKLEERKNKIIKTLRLERSLSFPIHKIFFIKVLDKQQTVVLQRAV